MNARYIEVREGDNVSSIEVLEALRLGGQAREFNLRLRRGIAPTDAALAEAVAREYGVPMTQTSWTISPMAGDRNLLFNHVTDPQKMEMATRTDAFGVTPREQSSIAKVPFVIKPEDLAASARPSRKGK